MRSPLWRWLLVLLFVLLLVVLLAPWWGRPLLQNAIRSTLLEQGWQTVQLQVTSLGSGQAKLGSIVLERPEVRLEIAEIALKYNGFELLVKKRVQNVIVKQPQVQAYFARQPADLIGALLLASWPEGEHLPFRRIYISEAQIIAQPSAGLQPVQLNAMLEHTPPRANAPGTTRLWANAQSPAPYAQLEITFEANLREQTLKATLDSEFHDLTTWRTLPLPPEVRTVLMTVREKLSLQGAAALRRHTLENWMLFGQSPAAIYTAPDGSHVEALGVDFGINVRSGDVLDYGWLRAASGVASNEDGSIEWQDLRSELKPGQHLNVHIDSAALRVELSSIARELMPAMRPNSEMLHLWRNYVWQGTDLSARIFAPEPAKNRPAFMRIGGHLKLGTLEYPWEKLEPLSPAFEAQLRGIPLLETLVSPAPIQAPFIGTPTRPAP